MAKNHVYMDYNATTPLKEEVKSFMWDNINAYGNASSMHSSGRFARSKIEDARKSVANLINAPDDSIIFSSGGSESNNTVFETMRRLASCTDGKPLLEGRREFIISAVEHPCIINSAEHTRDLGFKVHILPVDEFGLIDMDEFRAVLNKNTLLVSIMMANNEIGTVQNIGEICRLAKKEGAWVHSDAVQAVGKIPVNVRELELDYLTISAHKIYGPKGIGALYVRKPLNHGSQKSDFPPLLPLIHGGHQEEGLRAGTYNNLGIIGFGKAAELALRDLDSYIEKTGRLKERLKNGLIEKIENIKINGHPGQNLPNTLNVSFPGAEGESILLSMDMEGIEVSTGSACASGSLEPSHVLIAMGLDAGFAHSSIRFSLGHGSTEEDVDYVLEKIPPIISKLRSMSTIPH